MIHYAEAVVVNQVVLFWTSGCESWWIMLWKVVVNHDALPVCWAQWLWIVVCYAESVVMNNGLLFWASGCETWCVILSQWLIIMGYHAEPVVVNHGVLWWASGCESWWVMMSQWLWIMVCYDEPVVVNHGVLCTAYHTIIHNHWLIITHHSSQPLAQHDNPWLSTTGSE
jgi:hypothetical protein